MFHALALIKAVQESSPSIIIATVQKGTPDNTTHPMNETLNTLAEKPLTPINSLRR